MYGRRENDIIDIKNTQVAFRVCMVVHLIALVLLGIRVSKLENQRN